MRVALVGYLGTGTVVLTRAEHIASFTVAQRDYYRERAAIREYDGKQTRDVAEKGAYFETCRKFAMAPCEPELVQVLLFSTHPRGI
jgi:hypothetical protein